MRAVIERLNYLIEELPLRVKDFSDQEFSARVVKRWSKKVILGHLCDSATNNHHRFVKAQFEQPFIVVPYNQNDWLLIQDYQSIPNLEIVEFWTALNKQIVRVISKIPEEKLTYICDIGDSKAVTLCELIQDYMRHMDHHLIQIFGTPDL